MMSTEVAKTADKGVEFIPLGNRDGVPVKLTIALTRAHFARPTKRGVAPSDSDVIKFMKLCQANLLDPWTGDAYLVGFDSKDGPQFNLITAAQSFQKRAELNEEYDGSEHGVLIAQTLNDGSVKVEERNGAMVMDGERLLGGWARVYRRGRRVPEYVSVKLSAYHSGRSRWNTDPGGMIEKVALSQALRKCFPNLSGLYVAEEQGAMEMTASQVVPTLEEQRQTGLSGVTARLEAKQASQSPHVAPERTKASEGTVVIDSPVVAPEPPAAAPAKAKRKRAAKRKAEPKAEPKKQQPPPAPAAEAEPDQAELFKEPEEAQWVPDWPEPISDKLVPYLEFCQQAKSADEVLANFKEAIEADASIDGDEWNWACEVREVALAQFAE